jgi:hypothetical protein
MKLTNYFILLLILVSNLIFAQQNNVRPFIWVKASERSAILQKIEQKTWARDIFKSFIEELDSKIELHTRNPDAYIKTMPFDWEKALPNSVPPFFLTHHIEKGKNNNLDNATEAEMRNARNLMAILQTGIDCGIAYYLTENTKYAQCATDILHAFTNSVLQSVVSNWHGRGGWLFPFDGFREVREIGYKVPLIYDFTAEFIKNGGKPYDIIKKEKTNFSIERLQTVLRTYADITINYGGTGSNHPVLEAPNLVYNALAMDNAAERDKYLSYFLTQSTENQDALTEMVKNYKNEGDIWPETSQYFNGVSTILTELMLVVNKYDPTLRLGTTYSNVLFSLPALDYMVYPNNEIVRWGDGHRKGTPSFLSYENAFLLGKMDGSEKITSKFGPLLKQAIQHKNYKRKSIQALLWYTDEFDGDTRDFVLPRTDIIPHAGIYLQRNLSTTGKTDDALMCFVGGAHMVHGHAEGMNIELYGKGQVLGVDNGRGRYQQDIHENYSRIFAAHNTVIVNGSSQGEGGWSNLGIQTVQLKIMEPMPAKQAVSPNHSFSVTTFNDNGGEKSEAKQERLLALVRTSDTSGYYVDVFRSKSALPNEYHDYLYHNIGDELLMINKDMIFKKDSNRYQANAKGEWLQNRKFRNPGWHFFKNIESSEPYSGNVLAQFNVNNLLESPISMRAFIPGFKGREYSKVLAPPTFEAPAPYEKKTTPTLVIRNQGETWINPFVVVYEPIHLKNENNTIQSVLKLEQNGVFKGLKIVSSVNNQLLTQYLLIQSGTEVYVDNKAGIVFQGEYGIVTLDSKNKLQHIYMGSGHKLCYGKTEITSLTDSAAGCYIDFTELMPKVNATGKVKVTLNNGEVTEY